MTQLENQHKRDFEEHAVARPPDYPEKPLEEASYIFFTLPTSKPATVIEREEATEKIKDETVSPLTACADGSLDDSVTRSKNSGGVDNGWPDVETGLD